MIDFLKRRRGEWKTRQAQCALLRRFPGTAQEITRSQWPESLDNPTSFYERCFHYFHTRLPEPICEHRVYFETGGRGFAHMPFPAPLRHAGYLAVFVGGRRRFPIPARRRLLRRHAQEFRAFFAARSKSVESLFNRQSFCRTFCMCQG